MKDIYYTYNSKQKQQYKHSLMDRKNEYQHVEKL
jgi:hypothetical protein